MGYSTEFTGTLKFKTPLNEEQIQEIEKYLGEDCQDHPEWQPIIRSMGYNDLNYIDLDLEKENTGLKWNGSEKTYDLVEKINFVIHMMTQKFPDFQMEGELEAQGEDMDDRWFLVVENNKAFMEEAIIQRKSK